MIQLQAEVAMSAPVVTRRNLRAMEEQPPLWVLQIFIPMI